MVLNIDELRVLLKKYQIKVFGIVLDNKLNKFWCHFWNISFKIKKIFV